MNSGPDYEAKPDSVGPPVPVVSVKIVDDGGKELPVGDVGELWIKGPNVVKGYWGKPAATAETFRDGWFHTGDVARLDDEGFVYIVDRTKDMLIRGGENVYCVEIESVLHEHAGVADAAVIGIPHPVLGEEVGAVVQLRPGTSVSEAEIQEHVAARLAGFKVPVRVWLSATPLPRNPAGKVLKRQLRDELIADSKRRTRRHRSRRCHDTYCDIKAAPDRATNLPGGGAPPALSRNGAQRVEIVGLWRRGPARRQADGALHHPRELAPRSQLQEVGDPQAGQGEQRLPPADRRHQLSGEQAGPALPVGAGVHVGDHVDGGRSERRRRPGRRRVEPGRAP